MVALNSSLNQAHLSATIGSFQAHSAEPDSSLICSAWKNGVKWASGVAEKTISVVGKIFKGIAAWTNDTNAISTTLDRFKDYVIVWIEHSKQMPGHLNPAFIQLNNIVGMIDCVQIFDHIKYFYNKEWVNDASNWPLAARISGAVAHLTVAMRWFDQLGFYKLANAARAIGECKPFGFVPKVVEAMQTWPLLRNIPKLGELAASVGEVRVFGFISALSIDRVILGSIMGYYALSAVESIRVMLTTYNDKIFTSAGIDLMSNISELSLGALVFFELAGPTTLGVVGVTAIALAAGGFAYKTFNKDELSHAKLMDQKLINILG